MKILVTGGLGFIGSHTVVELQNEGLKDIQKFEIGLGIVASVLVIGGLLIYNK